jgi:hypothetical protein
MGKEIPSPATGLLTSIRTHMRRCHVAGAGASRPEDKAVVSLADSLEGVPGSAESYCHYSGLRGKPKV